MNGDGTTREDLGLPEGDLGNDMRSQNGEEFVVRISRHLQTSLDMLKNNYWSVNSIFSEIFMHMI